MSESLNLAKETTISKLLEMDSALDASLNDWDEEFSAGSITDYYQLPIINYRYRFYVDTAG